MKTRTMNDRKEKTRLAQHYEFATAQFSEAVKKLSRKMRTSPKEDYARLDRVTNESRAKSDQAQLALGQDITAHRCW
jgi:hypothetical protein